MENQKKYIGSVKTIAGNFGEFQKISFNKTDLEELEAHLNEKGWVNINMNKRREVGQYGQTHTMVIDDWKPEGNYQRGEMPQTSSQEYRQAAQQQAPAVPVFDEAGDGTGEDIPFAPFVDIIF